MTVVKIMGTLVSRCLQPCLQPWLVSSNSQKRTKVHLVSIERRVAIEKDELLNYSHDDEDEDEEVQLEQLAWAKATEQEAREKKYHQSGELNGDKGELMFQEEENIRLDGDVYSEAGARAVELAKETEKTEQTSTDLSSSPQPVISGLGGASQNNWLTEADGDDSAGESGSAQQDIEDFEQFLESVKKHSLLQTSFVKSGDPLSSGADFTLFEESVISTAPTQ